ncbi:MAG: RICIN domain-containing protein, partial [Oscillospiraceae bacterium]|nr:RICIN domain-containing protein [Oscillospiraceae bacterium]
MKKIKSRLLCVCAIVSVMILSYVLPLFGVQTAPVYVSAVSTDYPVQLMNIVSAENDGIVLSETGTADSSPLAVTELGGSLSCSWRFDYVGTDQNGAFFKICSAESGRLITPDKYSVQNGNGVIVYGSESEKCQHWYVVPVNKDRLGNGFNYKIVNYNDTSLALTRTASGIALTGYTGDISQHWLLNCDGLQGFAGFCYNDNTGKAKAADIGGL